MYNIISNQMNMNSGQFENGQSFHNKTLKIKLRHLQNKEISNYTLKEKIGAGSYAKVYRAIHKPTGQTVAVKVLSKNKMTLEEIQKVTFEVEIQKTLFHSNIARVYQMQQTTEKIFIFMEYCQNGELFNFVNKNGPLSQRNACKIFKQVLSAMKYMKSQRIFHRDIKCENILFDHNWNAKLVDFGFATKQDEGSFSRTFCGSPSYTAPEIAKRQRYHSQLIDIWCLGVTLYAMLAGRLPFDGNGPQAIKKNIMEIRYQFGKSFSQQAKQLFSLIFTEDSQRACIQDLQSSRFFMKHHLNLKANCININTDQVQVDAGILELMVQEFNINQYQVLDSVTKLKIDSLYAFYYLLVQRELNKGNKVKGDIASENFEKKKKRSTTLRLLKIPVRQNNTMLVLNDKNIIGNSSRRLAPTPDIKGKKEFFRVRNSNPSVDVNAARLRVRDDSPQSPKRILDLVSAYRRKF